MKQLLVIPIALSLVACSMTLPVTGLVQATGENFTGSATGHMDSAGELTITSSKGATCNGTFVYTTPRKGEGVFKCSDGRSGPFEFVSTGSRGTGHGTIDGQPITFTFGR